MEQAMIALPFTYKQNKSNSCGASCAIKSPLIKKCFEEDLKIRDDIIYYSKFLNMGSKSAPQLHWVLLLGFYSSQFKSYCTFAEPRDGTIESWTTDKLENKMDIASGKLFISVWI